jgi:hypothetical protein
MGFMVLVTYRAIYGEVIPSEAGMKGDEEAVAVVAMATEPISQFGLEGEGMEFDGMLKVVKT